MGHGSRGSRLIFRLPDRGPRPINDTPSYATESILLPRPPAHTRHVHVLHGRVPRVPGGADPTERWPLSQREMIELRTQSLSLCQRRRQRSVDWSGGSEGEQNGKSKRTPSPPRPTVRPKNAGKLGGIAPKFLFKCSPIPRYLSTVSSSFSSSCTPGSP